MNNEARAEEIFQQVAALPKNDRAEALSRLCAQDGPLRAKVESMLLAAADTHSFASPLGGNQDSPSPAGHAVGERPGDVIGLYKLLQQIGEGGFGVVFMAQQLQPIKRKVALKVIKLGMDTKQVIARFEAERQALAMMDHPNIARVFDAGATDMGRLFFVMELIKGVPITHYCDVNTLSTTERLDLFQQICHAVQHAHQKGIIHRDLKPRNVLVTLQDGEPVPKVIDFGIAKATNAELTERTLFTEFQQFIGTPEYMSPEQAEMSSMDIDTRSDIYSLGVLLYELLTGTTPFDGETLRRAGYGEIQRIIREDEPPKPSTRLNTLGDRLTAVARHRKTEPGKLANFIRGDLDWIVMKCLEKDRTRRYETANALAMEITRCRKNEPVLAGPPSAGYRLSKFVRRNRRAVVAGSVLTLTLLAGLVGTTTFAWRESQARLDAERRKQETEQVAKFQSSTLSELNPEEIGRVIKQEFRAQVESGLGRRWVEGDDGRMRPMTADEIAEGLEQFDTATDAGNPTDVARRMMTLSILTPAVEALERQFTEQPEVRARLLDTIGSIYQTLGLYESAEPLHHKAIDLRRRLYGEDHPDIAETLNKLAELYYFKGEYAKAEPYFRDALAMRLRLFGNEHMDVAMSTNNLGVILNKRGEHAEAERLYRDTLALRRKLLGDVHADIAESLNNLASLLMAKRDYVAAEPLNREALAMQRKLYGGVHPMVALSLSNLAVLLRAKGDYAAAEPLFREALSMRRTLLGDEHPDVATSAYNLAGLLEANGDYAAAEPLYSEALATRRKLLGETHPHVADSLNNLALLLKKKGDYSESESLSREVLALRRRLLGDEHALVALGMNTLASVLQAKGDYAEAEFLYRETLTRQQKLLGNDHPDVALNLNNFAEFLNAKGDYASAEPMFREALALFRMNYGDDHLNVAKCLSNLASLRKRMGDYAAAEPLQREALTRFRKLFSEDHPHVTRCVSNLATLLTEKGDYAAAEPLCREVLTLRRKQLGVEHPDIALSLHNLASLLNKKGDWAAAETMFREALVMRRKFLGDEHPNVASTLNNLAESLDDHGDYAAAEPMFREALAIREKKLPEGHPNTNTTRVHLGRMLTKVGRFSEAESFLLPAYDSLSHKPQVPVKRIEDVLKGLAELYEAWHAVEPDQGHDTKAAEWRAKLTDTQDQAITSGAPEPAPSGIDGGE